MKTNGGFIKIIVLILIAVLVLSYFNFDIKSFVESPQTQSNLGYTVSLSNTIWNNYLSKPITYFWNNIFLGLLWTAFLENFDLIKTGKPPINFQTTEGNTLPLLVQ